MQDLTSFFKKIEEIISSNLPFVVYRKPTENLVTVIVQNTSNIHTVTSFTEQGFVFAPFNKDKDKILFPEAITTKFSIEINDFSKLNVEVKTTTDEPILNEDLTKEKYLVLANKTIEFIQYKKAEKIVISRKEIVYKKDFKVLNSFKNMLKSYPNALVYLWFHPKVGCWMGASPERLIHIKNNKFKTMALAATQSYVTTTNVTWKPKEQQEQQFVTDYILKTIKSTVNGIKVSNPYTVKAGSLLHIRTDISGALKSKDALGNLVNTLHPTPAVCGLPKQIATDFIVENEGYNRSFYTGYLGELNVNEVCNLYVNLRCMEIDTDTISIYIGGGITKDSIAEKEWIETVFKAAIMKKIS